MMLAALPVLLAALATEAPAHPVRAEGWEVTLGAGAAARPTYPGSSSLTVWPLPLLDVKYSDRLFFSVFGGLGVNVVTLPALRLGVAVAPDFGRAEGSDARLSGWGHIDLAAVGRVFAEYRLGPLLVGSSLRHEFGTSSGTLADVGLSSMFPVSRYLLLIGGATLTWADAQYMREYFGINSLQLPAAFKDGVATAQFTPRAGLRDVALSLAAVVPFDRHWSVNAFFRGSRLLGDAANSPVTQQALQIGFGAALAYTFR